MTCCVPAPSTAASEPRNRRRSRTEPSTLQAELRPPRLCAAEFLRAFPENQVPPTRKSLSTAGSRTRNATPGGEEARSRRNDLSIGKREAHSSIRIAEFANCGLRIGWRTAVANSLGVSISYAPFRPD